MLISNIKDKKNRKKRFLKSLPLIFLVLGIIFAFLVLPVGVIFIVLSVIFFKLSFGKNSVFMIKLNEDYQKNIITKIGKENKLNINFKSSPSFDKSYLSIAKITSPITSVKFKNLSSYFYKRISVEDVCLNATLNDVDKSIKNRFRFIKLRFPGSFEGRAIITFNKRVYDKDLKDYGTFASSLNYYKIYTTDEISYSKICDSELINNFIRIKNKFQTDLIISINNSYCFILVNKENELLNLDLNKTITDEYEKEIITSQLLPLILIDTLHLTDLFINSSKKIDNNIPNIVRENIIDPIMKNIVNPIKDKFSPDFNKDYDFSLDDEKEESVSEYNNQKEEDKISESKANKDYTDNFF